VRSSDGLGLIYEEYVIICVILTARTVCYALCNNCLKFFLKIKKKWKAVHTYIIATTCKVYSVRIRT